jgi:HEAT repeat protein
MRVHAAEALGRIGDATAEKPLREALEREKNAEVKSRIANAP